jgi:hypothetical protein
MKTSMRKSRAGLWKETKMISRKKIALGGACAVLAALGTGVGGSRAANAGPSSEAWPFAAPHAPAPVLENPGGGPVIAKPRIVPIFFAADPLLPDLETFYSKLGTSTYLPSGLAEYGVGKPTFTPPVLRNDAAPIATDDGAASSWLVGQIASGALPAADGSTIYSLVFPGATLVTAGMIGPYAGSYPWTLCGSVSEATQTSDGTLVPFVLSALCDGGTGGASDVASETDNQSYALVTAITNPGWLENPAYSDVSWSGSGWTMFAGPYISTLCGGFIRQESSEIPADLGYLVQVLWSNAAARHGHDPCALPSAPPAVYFNAAPDIAGVATPYGMTKGVIIPPGGEVTIPVRLFSDGPMAAWTLGAAERADVLPDANGLLSFAFDKPTGRNGDVRQLTVHRAVAPDGSVAPDLSFEITSTSGTTVHEWLVVVGTD